MSSCSAFPARASASRDPRFPPVEASELARLQIEVSILTPAIEVDPGLRRLDGSFLTIGVHGLQVRRGRSCGLLLPVVASRLNWTAPEFLEQSCLKAGLSPDAWKQPETSLSLFRAVSFGSAPVETEGGLNS